MNQSHPCAIVGNGRMATHFAHYLSLSGVPFRRWARSENRENPADYLTGCRALFLLISDNAIASFLEKHPDLKAMNPIHFSGSLYLEGVPSMHPLMTFSRTLYSLEKYRSIPFIYESQGPSLQKILPELPNPSQALDPRMKALYHSLCVLSGNFTTLLWQKVFTEFSETLGLESDLLFPYLQQTMVNLQSHDWKDALTGPLARKDLLTVKKNLTALEGDPYHQVYRAFAQTVFKGESQL